MAPGLQLGQFCTKSGKTKAHRGLTSSIQVHAPRLTGCRRHLDGPPAPATSRGAVTRSLDEARDWLQTKPDGCSVIIFHRARA